MTDVLAEAAPGPAIEAELVSLTGLGQLIIDHDWIQMERSRPGSGGIISMLGPIFRSTLCCGAAPGYRWVIAKSDDGTVTMWPAVADTRNSDWEMWAVMGGGGLLLVTLGDGSGQFHTVDRGRKHMSGWVEAPPGVPTGQRLEYEVSPSESGDPQSRLWLLRNPKALQPGVKVPSHGQIGDEAIAAELALHELPADAGTISIVRQMMGSGNSRAMRSRRSRLSTR